MYGSGLRVPKGFGDRRDGQNKPWSGLIGITWDKIGVIGGYIGLRLGQWRTRWKEH